MKKFSTKNIFLLSVVILMTLIFVNLARQWGFPDTRFPLEKGEKIKLDESGAQQIFTASRDGLSGVNILFGGSNIKNGGTLSLSLLEADCATSIREEKRHLTTLNADNSTDFLFSRIPDSGGKTVCIHIRFTPEKGSKKAALFVIPDTLPNEKGALSINKEARPGESIAFRPVYRNGNLIADLTELNQRISQYKPWFLKGAFLGMLALLSIGLPLGFLILAISFREEKITPDNTHDTSPRNS